MAEEKEKSASDKLREEFLNPTKGAAAIAEPIEEDDEEYEAKKKVKPSKDEKQDETKVEKEKEKIISSDLTDDELIAKLRERGIPISDIESLADIKSKLQAPLSKEEQDQQSRLVRGEKVNFAIANNLGTVEEIAAWEQEQEENDEDIAFHDFAKAQKSANKNVTDEQIKKRFNKYYHQDMDDETISFIEDEEEQTEATMLKELGRNRIATKGTRRKEEIKNKLQTIDTRFNDWNAWQKKVTSFKDVVTDYIANDVDGTYTFDYEVGDEKIPITAKLGNKDDVQKTLQDFFLNTQAGVQIIGAGKYDKTTIKEYVEKYLWAEPKFRSRIANAIGQLERSNGLKEGKIGTTGQIKHPEREIETATDVDPMVRELRARLKS